MKTILKFVAPFLVFVATLLGLFYAFEFQQKEKRAVVIKGTKKELSNIVSGTPKVPGLSPSANAKMKAVLTVDGEKIYERIYETDAFYRRIPINVPAHPVMDVIFSGCSFTFGEGLPAEESLPYVFQQTHPDFSVHNISFPGGSIQHLIRYMEDMDPKEFVKTNQGYYIYVFFMDHLNRFLLRYSYLQWADKYLPYYAVKKGKVENLGSLENSDRWQDMQKAKKLGLDNTLVNSDPKTYSDEELQQFALAVKRLKQLVQKKLPGFKFVMATQPVGAPSPDIAQTFIEKLKANGIEYFDNSGDFYHELAEKKLTTQAIMIKKDGHPTKYYNEVFARSLEPIFKTESKKTR